MIDTFSSFLAAASFLALCIAIFKLYSWNKSYRAWRLTRNKFRLFAVRDQFIFLVAEGKLAEDGWLFQTFYNSINAIVSEQHRFTFRQLLKVMRSEANNAQSKDFVAELSKRLDGYSYPEPRRAVGAFYMAMFEIVIENSLTLRLARRLGNIGHHLVKAWQNVWDIVSESPLADKIAPTQIGAYEIHSSSERMINDLELA